MKRIEKTKRILIISSDKNLREILRLCFQGWQYQVFLHDSLACDIDFIKTVSPDVIVADVHNARKSQLQICQLLKDDFLTAFIPIIAILNKRQLRYQLLNIRQGIDDYSIKPPDPLDLRIRIEMAIKRSQYSFYTSPLTGLPSGRIIEETLREKIKEDVDFSFGYIDIDNFKYFNDVYGYLKGDRVIMQAAYILYTTIKKFGNRNDFIGHIGGDDFMFITTLGKYKLICKNFIQMFDKIIPFYYSVEDRRRGFVIAQDRTHKVKKIPLMSISAAVVNKVGPIKFKNTIEINDKVAEIKSYLKKMPGSKFMADRRSRQSDDSLTPQFNPIKDKSQDYYKPLGQILVEKNFITLEQLDEALKTHWKRGVILGEILKELRFISEGKLKKGLAVQEIFLSNRESKSKAGLT
jgi:GGDEF domain-containing protein